MTIEELRTKRIGLVLSGGGAKGAYQIGCWATLRKFGITRFVAVSGSSVGALNGFLIATDKFDYAFNLWSHMSLRTVIGVQLHKIVLYPLWLLMAVYRLVNVPDRDPDVFKRGYIRIWTVYVLVFWIFAVPATLVAPGSQWYQSASPVVVLLLTLNILSPLVRWVVLNLMPTTNTPLVRRLNRDINEQDLQRLNIPTYATLSRYQPQVPESRMYQGWLPEYVRMDKLSLEDVLKVLIQSSGLPGVFPVRKVLGHKAIDGGFCDNVPLAPLLYDPACAADLVIIIHLDFAASMPRAKPSKWRPEKVHLENGKWIVDETGIQAVELDAEFHWKAHKKFNIGISRFSTSVEEYKAEPHIIHVVPSESLGNFLTGTLNFSAAKSLNLIQLGQRDMERIVANLLKEAATA